ncbi:MAG TPA: hypothetical protein VGJ20_28315 [Xanthobacteraceae bacterium]|jgi:hypothetical protein
MAQTFWGAFEEKLKSALQQNTKPQPKPLTWPIDDQFFTEQQVELDYIRRRYRTQRAIAESRRWKGWNEVHKALGGGWRFTWRIVLIIIASALLSLGAVQLLAYPAEKVAHYLALLPQ